MTFAPNLNIAGYVEPPLPGLYFGQIAGVSSAYELKLAVATENTTGKGGGVKRWDSTNNRVLTAQGSAPTDAWVADNGSGTITPGALDPADLFAGGLAGDDWWPGDLATQWVDDAGTTPVTADGDLLGLALGRVNDVPLIQADGALKPAYKTSGGVSWWQPDGSNDALASDGAIDFSGTDKVTLFAAATFNSAVSAGALAELCAAPTSTAGAFRFGKSSNTAGLYAGIYKTALLGATFDPRLAWPVERLVCVEYDLGAALAADEMTIYVDGAVVAQTPIFGQGGPAGAGNFADDILYLFARGGASLPFTGRLYSLTIVGGAVSAAQRTAMFDLMAARSGFAL